ncbi:hypothetical protein GCM10020331_089260 [Ectobacillus funiculus]
MRQKLEEMLLRKGYTRDVVSICLEELEEEPETNAEWEAVLYQGQKYHQKNIRSTVVGSIRRR